MPGTRLRASETLKKPPYLRSSAVMTEMGTLVARIDWATRLPVTTHPRCSS